VRESLLVFANTRTFTGESACQSGQAELADILHLPQSRLEFGRAAVDLVEDRLRPHPEGAEAELRYREAQSRRLDDLVLVDRPILQIPLAVMDHARLPGLVGNGSRFLPLGAQQVEGGEVQGVAAGVRGRAEEQVDDRAVRGRLILALDLDPRARPGDRRDLGKVHIEHPGHQRGYDGRPDPVVCQHQVARAQQSGRGAIGDEAGDALHDTALPARVEDDVPHHAPFRELLRHRLRRRSGQHHRIRPDRPPLRDGDRDCGSFGEEGVNGFVALLILDREPLACFGSGEVRGHGHLRIRTGAAEAEARGDLRGPSPLRRRPSQLGEPGMPPRQGLDHRDRADAVAEVAIDEFVPRIAVDQELKVSAHRVAPEAR